MIESPLKHSIAKQKIEIRQTSTHGFVAYFAGRHLAVSEVIEPSKLSIEELELQKKMNVLALADKLGNVSEASRITGISRDNMNTRDIAHSLFYPNPGLKSDNVVAVFVATF